MFNKGTSSKHLRFKYIPRYHDEKKEEMDVRKAEIERQVAEGRLVRSTKRMSFDLKKNVPTRKKGSLIKPIIYGILGLVMLYAMEVLIVFLKTK